MPSNNQPFQNFPCACFEGEHDCICSDNERAMRHYAYIGVDKPMTEEQREWCVEEADSAGEGYFSLEELNALDDQGLAHAVLQAWSMYVSSNC